MTTPTALDWALERVGDRWTLLLVDALRAGPGRFGELQERVGAIAPNILVRRLRSLADDGLITAVPYSLRPLRHQYQLTAAGRDLSGVIALLGSWAHRHGGDGSQPLVSSASAAPATGTHGVCGTPLEARLWCPTCERLAEDGDDDGLIRV